jgi:hypothetical protein
MAAIGFNVRHLFSASSAARKVVETAVAHNDVDRNDLVGARAITAPYF